MKLLQEHKSIWKKIKQFFSSIDPAEYLKKKYKLSDWAAELIELIVGFGIAALIYFGIMPVVLGANPPAVIVQSCSMKGTLNVGDIIVLKGSSWEEINAPTITINSPLNFTIEPNNITKETKFLIFPDGQRLPVQEIGDIIVYNSKISEIQIIHRVIAKIKASDGKYLITKGDANKLPDAAKISCAEWETIPQGLICRKFNQAITELCDESDKGWAGCLGTPIKGNEFIGKQILMIPLLGHIKMMFFQIITLGHGYPAEMWC